MNLPHKLLASAILVVCTAVSTAQPINTNNLRNSPAVVKAFRDVVAKPSESVVRVQCDGKDAALGTIVGADGWILSKASELRGKIICKFKDGKSYDATIVGIHADYDLVLLKVPTGGLTPVSWRDTREAKVGKWVASVGIDKDPVAIGVVSVGTRAFKPGDQPRRTGTANAAWLGVGLEMSPLGATINSIAPKGPAERAGVRVNDVILEAAGRKISDVENLITTIQRQKPKDVVILKIKRGEEERDFPATLEAPPKGLFGNPQETMGSVLSNRRGDFPTILQHDTVIKPTDCGGPLVDLDGMTVGVNLARAGRTETYASPAEDVLGVLTSLKSGDLAPKVDVTKGDAPIVAMKATDLVLRSLNKLNTKDKAVDDRHAKTETLKLSAGGTYLIELASADFKSHVIVTDVKGNKFVEQRAGDDKTAKVSFTPTTDGDYRITITTVQPSTVGIYTLTVRKTMEPPAAKDEKKGKKKKSD